MSKDAVEWRRPAEHCRATGIMTLTWMRDSGNGAECTICGKTSATMYRACNKMVEDIIFCTKCGEKVEIEQHHRYRRG